jgi:hypothetical protein
LGEGADGGGAEGERSEGRGAGDGRESRGVEGVVGVGVESERGEGTKATDMWEDGLKSGGGWSKEWGRGGGSEGMSAAQ